MRIAKYVSVNHSGQVVHKEPAVLSIVNFYVQLTKVKNAFI